MKRVPISPRPQWHDAVRKLGLIYDILPNGQPYWNESAYYHFSSAEIHTLETASNTLQALCLKAAQHIIDRGRYAELGIPPEAVPVIEWAWNAEPPAVYGRFDLAYDGSGPPKLLEYNADTPTALLEASVIQWQWLQERLTVLDPQQFNDIHEHLVAKWKQLLEYVTGNPLYFTHIADPSFEDMMTVSYLRDTAEEAGFKTAGILIKDVGWNSRHRTFVDLANQHIVSLFKLYPWEWLVREGFGPHLLASYQQMQWIEPIWKMLLSNKGILPILWELNPGHPNLLEAHFSTPQGLKSYVRKPLLSREGANIELIRDGKTLLATPGRYGTEGFVCQAVAEVQPFDGNYPVVGSWMIDQTPRGIGIRESRELVTNNLSCFVPHLFT
jgi:glutathionylspermidine synthase